MKKTYIIPQMDITVQELQQIIAASPLNVTNDGDTANFSEKQATEGQAGLVKGGSGYDVWSDDWSK